MKHNKRPALLIIVFKHNYSSDLLVFNYTQINMHFTADDLPPLAKLSCTRLYFQRLSYVISLPDLYTVALIYLLESCVYTLNCFYQLA